MACCLRAELHERPPWSNSKNQDQAIRSPVLDGEPVGTSRESGPGVAGRIGRRSKDPSSDILDRIRNGWVLLGPSFWRLAVAPMGPGSGRTNCAANEQNGRYHRVRLAARCLGAT